MSPSLGNKLLDWYQVNARQLPWREHDDPYLVWVSEVMLQQTRVETMIPYFERWMARFPTLESLAFATQDEVLTLWEGLGYYSRARNLLQAAQIVRQKYGGQLPQDGELLRQLPGIGRYTAGAIASIAFGMDEPTLDGNIRRVLTRLFKVSFPAGSSKGEKRLWKLASENLVPGRAGEYNQALMDLGATICTPLKPLCSSCPLTENCQAFAHGVQEKLPVKTAKTPIPHHTAAAAIIQRRKQILIVQHPSKGLLAGMWGFPGGRANPGETIINALHREIRSQLGVAVMVSDSFGVYQHAYTHFRVSLHAFLCKLSKELPRNDLQTSFAWVAVPALADFPMGKIDRQIADSLMKFPRKQLPN
jgi:A/G-specific adenine glycosylase